MRSNSSTITIGFNSDAMQAIFPLFSKKHSDKHVCAILTADENTSRGSIAFALQDRKIVDLFEIWGEALSSTVPYDVLIEGTLDQECLHYNPLFIEYAERNQRRSMVIKIRLSNSPFSADYRLNIVMN